MPVPDLLLASNNHGKLRELQAMLPAALNVVTLAELGIDSPEETGATIAENSALKAVLGARASGVLTIADDSGLEVDALGGRPGVVSARYAGPHASDNDNIEKLLADLASVADPEPAARFVCVLTLATADGVLMSTRGELAGRIIRQPRGVNGFGYDPIVELSDGRTVAELSIEEKGAISHRSKALREMRPALFIAVASQRFSRQGDGQ